MFKFFKNIIIFLIRKCIECIEKYEYRNMSLDDSDISKKIINSINLLNVKVKTDTGFEEAYNLHITQPYEHYEVETELGYRLFCADNHILFDENFNEVFVKNIKVCDYIQTDVGVQKIKLIKKHNFKSSMFDLSVNHPNHRFYTNGILSHNTITAAIFMLHTILFSNDKNIMIVANIRDTTIEIVDKIKNIYSLLPFFLKPGVRNWNQKSVSFDNGCRIKTAARTKTPAIGFNIDFLYLDEFAHIPSNVIVPYYTAVFPTVSAINNSKIIITSTPHGMNLFHKILTDAERPDGDPQKNNYKSMRVYWHEVPGRFVTYVRLNDHKLYEYGVDKDYIYSLINNEWSGVTKVSMKYNVDISKYVIHVSNNDLCSNEDIKSMKFTDKNGRETSLLSISEITTWKEEAMKDIGGEDAFNQEYGLRFINSSRSILNESIIDDLLKSKKNFIFESISEFDNKLKFNYSDLKWIDDRSIFSPALRKNYKIVVSIDISEGLGQDYSVINIFKISQKPIELIELQKVAYKSIIDFFRLEQIGIYRCNIISIKQLAELLYVLIFEYFDPDNVRAVLELNNYGNTLLAEIPHVFDGNNNYGSYVFVKYKHKIDSNEEKIGLKVGDNKNILVKDYQDLMQNRSFAIYNEDNVREITSFVKHTTNAGNVRYAADVGHDDTVMTIVNATSIFRKNEFSEMVQDWMETIDKEYANYINNCLKNTEYIEVADYSQLLNIRRRYVNRYRNDSNTRVSGINWFGAKS